MVLLTELLQCVCTLLVLCDDFVGNWRIIIVGKTRRGFVGHHSEWISKTCHWTPGMYDTGVFSTFRGLSITIISKYHGGFWRCWLRGTLTDIFEWNLMTLIYWSTGIDRLGGVDFVGYYKWVIYGPTTCYAGDSLEYHWVCSAALAS